MNHPFDEFIIRSHHYLFESSGQAVVGYFQWRGSVIVVRFDASHDDSFDDINRHSNIRLLSVELARQDWNERVQRKTTFEWVTSLAGGDALEKRLKNISWGLAIQFRDKEEEHIKSVMQDKGINKSINQIINDLTMHIKTVQDPHEYEHNTQYALEA